MRAFINATCVASGSVVYKCPCTCEQEAWDRFVYHTTIPTPPYGAMQWEITVEDRQQATVRITEFTHYRENNL